MKNLFTPKPRIGISACLLGSKVRYDGGHKKDSFLTETFGPHVEWVSVCPEVEIGMGIPRESVRLVGSKDDPQMIAERSGRDWTAAMKRFAAQRARSLRELELAGYIFKKNSPSCGLEKVRVYNSKGVPTRDGRGLFATAMMRELPLLPLEEEGRLNDPALRENFIERVFAYFRWQEWSKERKSISRLIAFHTREKFFVLAHSPQHYQRLGRIVAEASRSGPASTWEVYGRIFMEALAVRATAKKHSNVLEHMVGYFSEDLSSEERRELLELIADFRTQLISLIVPVTLVRHYVQKYNVAYLRSQIYLEPHPKELMLRNHV
jgi:uncharacterized protein YbgA (DUF1722 family)/uncharacterized protein YbbK (DUF523 family)